MKRFSVVLLACLSGCVLRQMAPAGPPVARPPAVTEDHIAVYFSPRGGAMAALLGEIEHAEKSIDVQAYLLTSKRIARALEAAQRRGVPVRLILDKHNL